MKKQRWISFTILLLSAVTVSISQLKISPVMEEVASFYGITLSKSTMLMSLFTVAGIVLAIPGAGIIRRVGPERLLLLLMSCLCVGNLLGGTTTQLPILLLSRLIEGIAYALIILTGVMLISKWFASSGSGVATGIFNTFAAIGSFVTMNGAPYVLNKMGVRSLWWVNVGISLLMLVLVAVFIKSEQRENQLVGNEDLKQNQDLIKEAFCDRKILMLAAVQMLMAFILFGFITGYPLLFTQYYHLDSYTAGFYSGLNGLFGIPACVLCGILVEKTKKPLLIASIGAIGAILLGVTMVFLKQPIYILHILSSAVFPGGFVMTSIFCLGPVVSERKELSGYSVTVVNMFYYIGVFFSTPILAGLAKISWYLVAAVISGAAAMSFVLLQAVKGGTTES
ncbi:MFS transporter [Anaerocolumna aminovalerica]|uniref:MFS transporter n=1 Tax=Anaerocolumna aminovalerica TaxID=1527 RepID=UPI000BE25143|nr:MFS transporter [Anaerocolumna aminovalerica]